MALVYIVEDDSDIREIETIALKNSNYMTVGFENARDFFKKMDEVLPDQNGYEILKKIRNTHNTRKIPVIMVTAKTTEIDMIKGLDEGADDYIRKPFSIMELITRVKAVLRRTEPEIVKKIKMDNIVLDDERHEVTVNRNVIDLTFKEYELLKLLMQNAGIVMSRDVIMERVWDTGFEGETRTVDMHIKTLRKKLGESGNLIKTVRNVGYVME